MSLILSQFLVGCSFCSKFLRALKSTIQTRDTIPDINDIKLKMNAHAPHSFDNLIPPLILNNLLDLCPLEGIL